MARGGFRGGYGGMNQANMMKQAQKMQAEMMKKQQELEEARRAWEEDQMQREEAFREAEQVTTEPPGEDKDTKKQPSAGNGAGDDAPTELTLPVQAPKPVSPVRYILIGALLAAALRIALYLFTHPVREEDDPEDNE